MTSPRRIRSPEMKLLEEYLPRSNVNAMTKKTIVSNIEEIYQQIDNEDHTIQIS